jgi:hypothetical protein
MDSGYVKRVTAAIEDHLHDKQFLNMLQKDGPNDEYTEGELLLLLKMDTLLYNVVNKLNLHCDLEKSLSKFKIAFETGKINQEKLMKMIQSGDINTITDFIGGGKRKTRKSKKSKKSRKSRKSKKSKKSRKFVSQRGGIGEENVECSICLGNTGEQMAISHSPNDVPHMFHSRCIDDWRLRSHRCPLCNVNVETAPQLVVSQYTRALKKIVVVAGIAYAGPIAYRIIGEIWTLSPEGTGILACTAIASLAVLKLLRMTNAHQRRLWNEGN